LRAPTQITLLILLAATLAATASAAPNFVIRRDSDIGGFAIARDGSLKGEIDAFGAPSSRQVFGYDNVQSDCMQRRPKDQTSSSRLLRRRCCCRA
jgi:hypothetical protein